MNEQQSQKRGMRSDAQKMDATRNGHEPIPASSRVAGAFGDRENETLSDEELALTLEEKRIQKDK